MKLKEILKGVKFFYKGNLDIEIFSISQNVNKIKEDCLFCCYKGVNFDGHDFIKDALKRNIKAVIVEKFTNYEITQILVKDTRKILAKICENFFNVLRKIKLIGVTGTNGKTTTSTFIYNILSYSNLKAGLIGTNGIFFDDIKEENCLTTPDTVDLFEIFSEMVKKNVKYVVMEVSAHAIDLNKLFGIKFEIGAFTNLSQDHLDYFKTISKYALTKQKFLKKNYCKNVFINIDDEYGRLFYKLSNSNKFSYGICNPATCFTLDLKLDINKTNFIVNTFDSIMEINNNFTGLFNVYNALCAISICKFLGVESDNIVNAFVTLKQVDGRMNFYRLKNGVCVVIDFAHTPDGLEKVLKTLSQLKDKDSRLICVFGCGGNRDRDKRSKMGKIASENSDYVFLTSDNPRNEKPMDIINDVMYGISKNNVIIDDDRRRAIIKAINFSKKNDIVLIAGKGNEDYQEINNIKIHFSDKEIIDTYTKCEIK